VYFPSGIADLPYGLWRWGSRGLCPPAEKLEARIFIAYLLTLLLIGRQILQNTFDFVFYLVFQIAISKEINQGAVQEN
jgi:hypothetical protein